MIGELLSALFKHWAIVLPLALGAWLARNHFNRSLHKFHGPLIASFTDWWRFVDVYSRRPDITLRKLHDQYGDFVRLGPNCLSIADPKALKIIYGLNKGFTKSGFYPVQQAVSKGERLPSLFSTTDEQYHAQLRRCVNSAFSMSAMVQYEAAVTEVTEQFLEQTDAIYAKEGTVCDFATWLQYLAFDVIGQITYSKSHGFVERHDDVDNMVRWLRWMFDYAAPIGQIPFLDLVFLKNPILLLLDKFGIRSSTFPVVTFAKARMAERLSDLSAEAKDTSPGFKREDLLSLFLKAKDNHPDFFHDGRVLTMAVSMAFAGSETTAISSGAVFYYLLQNPKAMQALRAEIQTAEQDGRLQSLQSSRGLVSWTESQQLPYLDACVKEAFRLHPAAGLPLERVVPSEGVVIADRFVPGGTIVGCSAWVLHRRAEPFGPDFDTFRPERWIEATPERRKEMEGLLFQFGMGSRTCIGKNISLLEIYKIVPSFLRRFDIELDDPEKEWTLHNSWFVRQLDFNCRFRARPLPDISLEKEALKEGQRSA